MKSNKGQINTLPKIMNSQGTVHQVVHDSSTDTLTPFDDENDIDDVDVNSSNFSSIFAKLNVLINRNIYHIFSL